jgi:hypothetical protein
MPKTVLSRPHEYARVRTCPHGLKSGSDVATQYRQASRRCAITDRELALMSQTLRFVVARKQIRSLICLGRNAISLKAQREAPRKPGAHRAHENLPCDVTAYAGVGAVGELRTDRAYSQA